MTLIKPFIGATGLALLAAVSIQLEASAQVAEPDSDTPTALDQRLSELTPAEPVQSAGQPVSETLDSESVVAVEAAQPEAAVITELPTKSAEPISASAEPLLSVEPEPRQLAIETADETVDETADDIGEVAQVRRRRPRIGAPSSFIGIGGNIGLGDNGAPGSDPAFAVISKLAFSRRLSVRPAALIGDDVSFLVPVTYSFGALPGPGQFALQPYAGGGAAFTTGDNSEVTGLVSAGVDVPLSRNFTANGQANLSLGDQSGFGVTLGVGYNFGQVFQ